MYHSRAYRILREPESQRIAANLGLDSATTAKVCLDCHTDNVTAEKRGDRFQIDDGVGCEACHGGAENWIQSHAAEGATHADNLANGMYPTESPVERAKLCLSCHMGSPEKFASHDIMGAGHPRLSFELESFTVNQPAHYAVDDDYRERKGQIPGFNLWLTGQVESARRFLTIVRQEIRSGTGLYPELALYDCHACHHSMDDIRWTTVRAPDIGPGSLRLQDQHLLVITAVITALGEDAADFTARARQLIVAGQEDAAAVVATADGLIRWLEGRQADWSVRRFSDAESRAVRRALVSQTATGRMSDYNAAEQVYLSLESLSYSIGDRDRLSDALDRLYEEVKDHAAYDPASFAATARNLTGQF